MPRRKFLVWMWGCPYKNNVWTAAQMQKCGWLNSYSFSFWFFLKKLNSYFCQLYIRNLETATHLAYERPVIKMAWVVAVIWLWHEGLQPST
jgi:hypothetical protein